MWKHNSNYSLFLNHALVSFKVTRRNGESNQMKSLRRIMQPRCDGTLLVPQEVLNDWKDVSTGGRDRVLKMWEQCSHDKVRGHWFCLLLVCSSNCFLFIQHSKLARMCFCENANIGWSLSMSKICGRMVSLWVKLIWKKQRWQSGSAANQTMNNAMWNELLI